MRQCSFSAVAQIIHSGFRIDGPTPEDFLGTLFEQYYRGSGKNASIDTTTASRWLNGNRPVSREIVICYGDSKGLAYLKEAIETSIIPDLSDPTKTVGQIYDLVKGDITVSKEKKAELSTSYSRKNDAEMANYMATILQFAMLRNDIESDDLSELDDWILNARIPAPCQYFLGRKNELSDLHEILKKSKNVFIEGIGGIGKSEFVKAYIRRYRKDFTDVLYFVYSGSLKKTIASMEVDGEKAGLSEDEKFKKHLSFLRKLSKNACLVIDNFDVPYTKDKDLQTILALSCHVLFTTRSRFESIQNDTVFLLNEITNTEELLKLMANYYPDASSNRDAMMGIIDIVHSHTLSVELAARLLATGILTPSELQSKLQNENVALDSSDEIVLTKDGKPRKATYQKHIHLLFALFRLSNRQKSIMCCMAFIPLSGVPATLFSKLMGKDNNNDVNALVERGLIRRGNEQLISLHPLITEVVVADLHPSITSCKPFLESIQSTILTEGITFSELNTLISITDSIVDSIGNDDPAFYLRFLEDIFNFIEEYRYKSGMERIVSKMDVFLDDPSNGTNLDRILLYDFHARLKIEDDPVEALELRKKALSFVGQANDENASVISNLHANLGSSYYVLDQLDKAIENMRIAHSLREQFHLPLDVSYINQDLNYAIIISEIGEYAEAIKRLETIEEFTRRLFPYAKLRADILETLGLLLIESHRDPERGETCFKEGLSIYKKVYQARPEEYNNHAKDVQDFLIEYGIALPLEYLAL